MSGDQNHMPSKREIVQDLLGYESHPCLGVQLLEDDAQLTDTAGTGGGGGGGSPVPLREMPFKRRTASGSALCCP